jgi:hypothetical protein
MAGLKLPGPVAAAAQPLFDLLPLECAMEQLVVERGATAKQVALVEEAIQQPAIAAKPALCAGLWLYVDELDRSHVISQGIADSTGSFWHGIMHRREGDFSNSHYWFNRVGPHPAIAAIPDYDPHGFIDEVEREHRRAPERLIARQRAEWSALFAWCAAQ